MLHYIFTSQDIIQTSILHTFQGIIKAIRELKGVRKLNLWSMSQVDNSVLEAAVSEVESSDETRRLHLDCISPSGVDASSFMQRFEGAKRRLCVQEFQFIL